MLWKIIRTILLLPILGLFAVTATMCTQLGLNYASLEVDNKLAATPALEAVTAEDWARTHAPRLQAALESHVFGPVPVGVSSRLVTRRVVDERYLGGQGVLEEWTIELGSGAGAIPFRLAIAYPRGVSGPVPIVIGQTFCGNRGVFEHAGLSAPIRGRDCGMEEDRPLMGAAFKFVFGRYITRAPLEDYLARGIAYANFFAEEVVPDRAQAGRAVLEHFPAGADGRRPTGAVAAWAAGYFAAIDHLAADDRIDADHIAVFGHSRHGKSALVAGAWDERIAAVISHQSGTGGASLSKQKPGETVKQLLEGHSMGSGYPHWFDPRFVDYADDPEALPVDQHMVIALNAPRRVFLGNGRRDVWSDPNGAFRAARGANPAYAAFGRNGLRQPGLLDFDPQAGIAFHMRPGGHGIVRSDVDAFLAFLDSAFSEPRSVVAADIVQPSGR